MTFDFTTMLPVFKVFLALVALLSLATIVTFFINKRKAKVAVEGVPVKKEKNELQLRINSWWVMIGVFGVSLLLGPMTTIYLFAILSFLGLKEYFSMTPTRQADRRVLFWAHLTIPFQYYWVATGWYGMFIIFIPIYAFLFMPFRMVLAGETKNYLKAASNIHWGLMLTVFTLSHLAFLVILPMQGQETDLTQGLRISSEGAALLLYLVLLTQLNDVSQYISGKLFGSTPIAPNVSPNKTRGGLIGGVLVTGLLAALLATSLTPMVWWQGMLVGFGIAIAGFIGDISMSAIKRDAGIKDTGQVLPGHGGILDRLDSLTFTAPLFFHLMHYYFY